MSHIEVIHTDHIKPTALKELILEVLEQSQNLMASDPESGDGWCLVNAAMALRKYNDILEAAYVQSLREGYGGSKKLIEHPVVTQIHDETIIHYRNAKERNPK